MATEFYMHLSPGSTKPAPVSGRITQIVGGPTASIRADSNSGPELFAIPNTPSGGDALVVIPVTIPIRIGQLIACLTSEVTLTVTGQGA